MDIKKIISLLLISLIFFTAGSAIAIEDEEELFRPIKVKDDMTLSIGDCVAAAFQNSPKIRRQKCRVL